MSSRMDVVPDKDLHDFIDSVDFTKAKVDADNTTHQPSSSSDESDGDDDDHDVWEGIADALESWTQRILDAEARHSKSSTFRQRIEESLKRQQQDGFLADNELVELRYIADLWQHLLEASSCYTIGCEFLKRNILQLLLELHSLQQISSSVFIDTCLKL